MNPEIPHHRNIQDFFPEISGNFLEMRRVFFAFGEKTPEPTGLDFLEKSEMGKQLEAETSLNVYSKLGFLKQKISLTQAEKVKKLENTSEMFQTLFEMPEGVENYALRKETFENSKQEILDFAEKSFQPFELKQLQNFRGFSGAKLQNIALKRWLKSQIFNPQNFLIESQEREKNNITNEYLQEYFDNPENNFTWNKEENLGSFNIYNTNNANAEDNKKSSRQVLLVGPQNENLSEENDSTRYVNALDDLYRNMKKKGEVPRKDSLIIISDIKKNRLIVRQKGKPDWVIPSVYGKSIGSVPGSKATPTGSFKVKTRKIVGEGNPASSTPNITGAAISLYGLESSNSNSFGRGILIHGLPGVNQSDIVARANTYGCTGLTDADAIELAKRINSSPNAYMQAIT